VLESCRSPPPSSAPGQTSDCKVWGCVAGACNNADVEVAIRNGAVGCRRPCRRPCRKAHAWLCLAKCCIAPHPNVVLQPDPGNCTEHEAGRQAFRFLSFILLLLFFAGFPLSVVFLVTLTFLRSLCLCSLPIYC
jgi:hypothetical protein